MPQARMVTMELKYRQNILAPCNIAIGMNYEMEFNIESMNGSPLNTTSDGSTLDLAVALCANYDWVQGDTIIS